jgi:hypothetical protein
MSKRAGKTIAIREESGGRPRKITKVVSLGDQGFSVIVPYHRVKTGVVGKMPIDYKRTGLYTIPTADFESFTAEDRVKLSYHSDGFAQFSGENPGKIISGRDPVTGQPKGVGLFTHPLSNPIRSGPSVGITAWGLNNFDELDNDRDALIFEPDDLYYRACTPGTSNGYFVEFFVFPLRYWAGVQKRQNEFILKMMFPGFDASGAIVEMKALDLPGLKVVLAGFVSHTALEYETPSGWTLNGPGNSDAAGKGHVLFASYSTERIPVQNPFGALDRTAQQEVLVEPE